MEKREILVPGFEGFYDIYEDGRVWSRRKGRFIKPSENSSHYIVVYLTGINGGRWFFVHRLVLGAFVGLCPDGMEAHHVDHDKNNNHWRNLEWATHSENILRSYRDGDRESYWLGRNRGPHSRATREKMALAKEKPVRVVGIGEFRSIGAVAEHFGSYREKVYRCLRYGRMLEGHELCLV